MSTEFSKYAFMDASSESFLKQPEMSHSDPVTAGGKYPAFLPKNIERKNGRKKYGQKKISSLQPH